MTSENVPILNMYPFDYSTSNIHILAVMLSNWSLYVAQVGGDLSRNRKAPDLSPTRGMQLHFSRQVGKIVYTSSFN